MSQVNITPKVLLAFGFFFILALTGCTTVSVVSDPPEARVLWSHTGLEPFYSWPPSSWQFQSKSTRGGTPFFARGLYGDTIFITVEKEGYRRPLPRAAQLYLWRNEQLYFKLDELPETYAARMGEEGKVLYRGEWVEPGEQGLVEYNGTWMPEETAERRRMLALGMVEYEGEWLPPEVAENRLAEDMAERGFVQYKDRWLPPEEVKTQREIDERVAAVRETKSFADLPSPRILGTVTHPEAQVQLFNRTGRTVRFLFSGPGTRSLTVEPFSTLGARSDDRILIEPGRYHIVILQEEEMNSSDRALWGNWPLNAGMEYSFTYSGKESSWSDDRDQLDLPPPRLDVAPPPGKVPEIPETP